MEDALTLNLNFSDLDGASLHPKLDWRERKRQVHAKRNNRRQRGPGPPNRAVVPSPQPGQAAATSQLAQADGGGPNKRQKLQPVATAILNGLKPSLRGDTMHGYHADLASPAPSEQQQQPQQQQQQQVNQQAQQLQHQPLKQSHSKPQKASSQLGERTAGGKHTVVKGALAKLQESADTAAPSAEEQADILALVQLNLLRDQQLQQEQQQQTQGMSPSAAVKVPEGVVEFGDAEDEPDYAQLAQKQVKLQQSKQHNQQQEHAQKASQQVKRPQQQLVQHRAGELAHAEPNVPAESRLQLFGAAAAAGSGGGDGGSDASSWRGLGLSDVLSDHLEALNFQEPTQVQKHSIPVLLSGRDALVRSPTGSGKTLAYLGPMVQQLAARQPRITRADGTFGVVLVPTRELAVQVSDVLTALVRRFCWLVPGILIGGEHRGHEKARLRKGVTVLVATPGRLMDHLENTTSFKADRLSWLVLDEADRLLDLGFEAKLKAIIAAFDSRSSNSPCRRQTVLLSATLHTGLSVLAGLSLHNPVAVGFKADVVDGQLQLAAKETPGSTGQEEHEGPGLTASAAQAVFELPQQLQQKYVCVDAKMRLVYLIGVLQSRLRRSKACKVVVFFSNCDSVDFHHSLFEHQLQLSHHQPDTTDPVRLLGGVPVLRLHGDMLQPERTSSLVTFAKATTCVLLCTDVAARGLDFPAVSTIIQYDPAGDPAEYVHRVGRTARMGQQGEALLFLLHSELLYLDLLQQRGMKVQQEGPDAVLRCLPALLSAQDPAAAGSIHRLAKRLKLEASAAHTGERADPGAGGASSKHAGSRRTARAGGGGGLPAALAEGEAAGLMLQRQLVQAISTADDLKGMALNAFRSFIRAYATHPSALKHVFHIKSLHLGHLAASFGLREAPTRIGASGATAERKKRKVQEQKATEKRQKAAWHKAARAAVDGS